MKQDSNKPSFSDVLATLDRNVTDFHIGDVSFEQVTYKQQRKILSQSFDQVEIPVRMNMIHSEYIENNVSFDNDVVSPLQTITLANKTAYLVALRVATLGNKFKDEADDEEYEFVDVNEDDLYRTVKDGEIAFGDFKIVLSVPTLEKDNRYNAQLLQALTPFKNKRNLDSIIGQIADIYEQFNIFKYIKSVSMGELTFDFDERLKHEKEQFVNKLGADIIASIKEYIDESIANDEHLLTVTSKSQKTKVLDVNSLFITKGA